MDVLLKQIKKRGRMLSRTSRPDYLTEIQDAYFDFLKTETETPVLILELGDADFQRDDATFEAIAQVMSRRERSAGSAVSKTLAFSVSTPSRLLSARPRMHRALSQDLVHQWFGCVCHSPAIGGQ